MSDDERLHSTVEFSRRMREQRCTTPGHEDRHGEWLIPHENPNKGQRWVCGECRGVR